MDTLGGFARPFVPEALWKTAPVSERVQAHLRNVYALLCLGFVTATVGAWWSMRSRSDMSGLTLLGAIGSLLYLSFTTKRHEAPSQQRVLIFLFFTLCKGASLGPLLSSLVYSRMENVIISALLGTVCIFFCFSGFALFSRSRSQLYLGGALGSAASILLVTSLLNMFMHSPMLFSLQLYLGLAVFIGYIVVDTQQCIHHAERGEKDYVMHAVDLFVDLVAIFVRLAIILQRKEENKRRRRD